MAQHSAADRFKGAARAARALFAIGLLSLAPADAFAYIDPGSGLLLIQGLLAVIGGVIVFVKDPVAGCKRIWERCFSGIKNRHR